MSDPTAMHRGWVVKVRPVDAPDDAPWDLAPVGREVPTILRSDGEAARYASECYGSSGAFVDWRVVPFVFYG